MGDTNEYSTNMLWSFPVTREPLNIAGNIQWTMPVLDNGKCEINTRFHGSAMNYDT